MIEDLEVYNDMWYQKPPKYRKIGTVTCIGQEYSTLRSADTIIKTVSPLMVLWYPQSLFLKKFVNCNVKTKKNVWIILIIKNNVIFRSLLLGCIYEAITMHSFTIKFFKKYRGSGNLTIL